MPARSSVVLKLPPALRERLEARIIEAGFGRYAEHAAWLERRGHRISVSAVQRYGARLREELSPELARVRVSTAKARMLVEELRGRGDDFLVTDAALALVQERMFEALVTDPDLEELVALREMGRTLATTTEAQARVAREKRLRREAQTAGKTKRRGLSITGEARIRSLVEGHPE